MEEIIVELGERSYPIYVGDDLLSKKELFYKNIKSRQVMVISNETVAQLYLDKVLQSLGTLSVATVILNDGEQYKTLDTFNDIITQLLHKKFSRDSCLIALGGGVVGDITGFVAACYQRGIDFVQIPTTILAQVDSSVGGKTAVNHAAGKNMIGAFHQPICVIADTSVLSSLDKREISAGLAEVIKYGLIRDADFFNWLKTNIDKLLNSEPQALTYVIGQSCRNKARIVTEDERESNIRAILNFGHTFGHAIETGIGYGKWLHGEAIALGMLMAADLSQRIGLTTDNITGQLKEMLVKLKLPYMLPDDCDPIMIRKLMSVDKKVKDGALFLVLLKSIGDAVITKEFDENLLMDTLNCFSSYKNS